MAFVCRLGGARLGGCGLGGCGLVGSCFLPCLRSALTLGAFDFPPCLMFFFQASRAWCLCFGSPVPLCVSPALTLGAFFFVPRASVFCFPALTLGAFVFVLPVRWFLFCPALTLGAFVFVPALAFGAFVISLLWLLVLLLFPSRPSAALFWGLHAGCCTRAVSSPLVCPSSFFVFAAGQVPRAPWGKKGIVLCFRRNTKRGKTTSQNPFLSSEEELGALTSSYSTTGPTGPVVE